MELLDGKKVREHYLAELKEKLNDIGTEQMGSLVVIQVGEDAASTSYIKQKAKLAKELGISFSHYRLNPQISTNELCDLIEEFNNREYVTGIILQLPIPKELNYDKIRNKIHPNKDIDGVSDTNILRLVNHDKKALIPCTALGVMKLLEYYDIDPKGMDITIIGRSIHIGKALHILLLEKDATITMCHSKTKDVKKHTIDSDLIVSSVGKADFITPDMVNENATIIDVGYNFKEGKICGDASKDINCKYITPVPGGVGQMTVYAIYENYLKAYLLTQVEKVKKYRKNIEDVL